jgi:hypothetical protein
MVDRILSAFRNHGEASAMLGGGVGILAAIGIGILVLQSAMAPTDRAAAESSRTPTTESSPKASFPVAYPPPSPSDLASTGAPVPVPTADEGGYLEDPDLDVPTNVADPTAAPTSTPTATPMPTAQPTPTAHPTPTPVADGRVQLIVRDALSGYPRSLFRITKGGSVGVFLDLIVNDLDRDQCSMTQVTKPDDPAIASRTIALRPLATQTVDIFDGWNTFKATCSTAVGPVEGSLRAVAHDGQPEACKGFEFVRDDITALSFDDLASGVVGTWTGCATTPWTPMYKVRFVLRADGTYSATSGEGLDGVRMIALYYGMDRDSSLKRYALTDMQASGLGLGEIDVDFGSGSVVRDELRNIRLMGDKLEFEMFHFGQYGPITFRLNRAA